MTKSWTAKSFFKGFHNDLMPVQVDTVNGAEIGMVEQSTYVHFIGSKMLVMC